LTYGIASSLFETVGSIGEADPTTATATGQHRFSGSSVAPANSPWFFPV